MTANHEMPRTVLVTSRPTRRSAGVTWIIAVSAVMALGLPRLAAATGVNLAWGTCVPNAGNDNRTFACDTDDAGAPFTLVMSFRSPISIASFVGVQLVLDLCGGSSDLPNWWAFGSGECRSGSFTFPAPVAGIGTGCMDPWAGTQPGGGLIISQRVCGGSAASRIVMSYATTGPSSVVAGDLVLAGVAAIDQQRTIGGGALCGGCDLPVCLVLESVEVFGYGGGEYAAITNQDARLSGAAGLRENLCRRRRSA